MADARIFAAALLSPRRFYNLVGHCFHSCDKLGIVRPFFYHSEKFQIGLSCERERDVKKITALFLINPSAHPQNEVSSIRSLFSSHLSFGRDGLVKMKMN